VEVTDDGRGVTIEDPKAAAAGPAAATAGGDAPATKAFAFDHAYGSDTTQDRVYDDLGRPLLEAALAGFNGTIFAYGQTGSGKTWSMLGDGNVGGPQAGIIPKLCGDLFDKLNEMKARRGGPTVAASLSIHRFA
jgi:hypothetical protein